VVPPSTHQSGEVVRFEAGFAGTPANVEADLLFGAVRRVAAAALLARRWPAQGSRHTSFLALAGVLARAGWTVDGAKAFHHVIYRCLWPTAPDVGAADAEVQSTFEKYRADAEVTGVPTLLTLIDKRIVSAALEWLGIDRVQRNDYQWNDTGNADRLADLYGEELVYCTERRSYYVWTGQVWKIDEFVEVEKRAEKTMLEALGEAKHISDPQRRAAFARFINKSLSRIGLSNLIHLAKKKVPQVGVNDFDKNPWHLNVENGTVDLRTGVLEPHEADDLLSKCIPIRYDPRAESPKFMDFLFRIMGSHAGASEAENIRAEQLVSYLQKVFGCAATGKPEKLLFLLHGRATTARPPSWK
jgi:hypothetical protein